MKRAYTIERNELIVDLYKKGKTIREISENMNLSELRVKEILAEASIVVPKSKEYSLIGEQIANLLLSGVLSRSEISRQLGVSTATVAYYVKKLGLVPGFVPVSPEEIETMKDLRYNQGLSNKQIAERIGRSLAAVQNHLGSQPHIVSEFYRAAGRAKKQAEDFAAAKARKYYAVEKRKAEEVARIEAERIERERLEALRLAKENEIKELLAGMNIPCDSFHIDTAEAGTEFINTLIAKASEMLPIPA